VLLDTNVLASGLATRGLCTELFERILSEHQLLVSEPLLRELHRVLIRKFHLPPTIATEYVDMLESEGEMGLVAELKGLEFEDPDDIPILASAVGAKADFLVTGDKAMLALGEIDEIPILSPRQYWQRLTGLKER
jgi:putative PIN family toxin of toxin-antitoxin system